MIFDSIESLIDYAIKEKLIYKEDTIYIRNRIFALLNITDPLIGTVSGESVYDLLDQISTYAVNNNIIEDTLTSRDIFETELMGLFVDRPSNVINNFSNFYQNDKDKAFKYFYNLSLKSNYIRKNRIDKNICWKTDTKYGQLDITINLSKPEKDPKDIIKAANSIVSSYPQCALCVTNEGYKGDLNHQPRSNIRLIPLSLDNEEFYLQYSPYAYYNEHCIVLNKEHKPMVINKEVFKKLLDFIDFYPKYFIGSNADLPIVGGSILSHEHFQGGRYEFAMDRAREIYNFKVKNFENVNCSIVKWPLSVIRLTGSKKEDLIELSNHILNKWINYNDVDNNIISFTDDVRHNTITPIARKKDDNYIIDLVLRNNLTDDNHPLGIFHPRNEYHNIKKENIGLIEVMGLAILPKRLLDEINLMKQVILNDLEIDTFDELIKHEDFIIDLMRRYEFTESNIDNIIKDEIGKKFELILEDCGVFKQTSDGINSFKKFTNELNNF